MKSLAFTLAVAALLAQSGAAQRRTADPTQAPMRALASALAVLAPMPGQSPRTLAQMRALPSGVKWLPKPVDADGLVKSGQLKVGDLAGASVFAPANSPITSLEFYWENPPGHPFGFDPLAAMKRRGFKVRTTICQNDGMVSETWRWYEVTLPGRQIGAFYVHAFDAPMGGSMAIWNISYDFTGKKPSLSEANADMTEPLFTDQCVQE